MENDKTKPDTFHQLLFEKVEVISRLLQIKQEDYPLKEKWLDISKTCEVLKISKRTLQSYRDNGIIGFSQIQGKIYFKASDIEDHLKTHYKKAFNK